jgi:hypothetical protein
VPGKYARPDGRLLLVFVGRGGNVGCLALRFRPESTQKRSFGQTIAPQTKAVLRREYSGSVAWRSNCDLLADVQEMVRESENGWVTRRLHDQLKHGLRK